MSGFKGIEEGCEIILGEIEEVAMYCEREKRAKEEHGTDLRFSSVNCGFDGDKPDAERLGNFLTFLQIEMMSMGKQGMKSEQDHSG